MFHEQLTKNLKEGETLVETVRRDVLAEFRPITLSVVLVLLDFFFLTYLIKKGTWGMVGFAIVLVVAVLVGIRALIEWQMNVLLITNERVIHVLQRGFFTRTVAETTYGKVTDVRSTVKGAGQTILGIGSIEVLTANEGSNMVIDGVRSPSKVQAVLTSILRSAHDTHSTQLSAQELVAALTKAKQELGPKAFSELLGHVNDGRPKQDSRQ